MRRELVVIDDEHALDPRRVVGLETVHNVVFADGMRLGTRIMLEYEFEMFVAMPMAQVRRLLEDK